MNLPWQSHNIWEVLYKSNFIQTWNLRKCEGSAGCFLEKSAKSLNKHLALFLIMILKMKICSRFVFELVIWPQELTLARWTQPLGPLCLLQCFFIGQSATWCHLEILNLRARNCAIRKLFAQLAKFPKLLIVRLSMTLEDNKLFSERDTHSKR